MENWEKIEKDLNKKELEQRLDRTGKLPLDLPPELQAYISEEIPQDTELSSQEEALAQLRMENVRKAAREFREIDDKKNELQKSKLAFDKIFKVDLGANRPPQIIGAMRKIDEEFETLEKTSDEVMQSNPEAYIVRNALELRDYRAQLREGDFVLTPYGQKKLTELESNYYSADKVPFLNGETGSGKSSIAKYFCKEVLSSEPERIPGAKGIDETKIFGKINLSSDEKGPQAVFIKGPLYRAMENGVPLVIEEVNAIPPETLKSLNDLIINAKKGEEVSVIGDPKGGKTKAKEGFGVIMTGNLNRNPKAINRYKGTYELSADFLNRVRPIDYDYLPQSTEGNYKEEASSENELFTLMIASVMTDKGDMNGPEDAFDDLWRLAKFTRKIQEVYSGQRDGKLYSSSGGLEVPLAATSSVISMRDVKHVLESWKRDNFKNELDYYIYKELIAPLTNTMDVKFFVQQLQTEGFLADDSWEEVVAKAGTFDSAIHAPENKGKDLKFTPVREVVETVYGGAPERREFPYDMEFLEKSKDAIGGIKHSVEKANIALNELTYIDYKNSKDISELKKKIYTEATAYIEELEGTLHKIEDDLSDNAVQKDRDWYTQRNAELEKYIDGGKQLLANKIGERMMKVSEKLSDVRSVADRLKVSGDLLKAKDNIYTEDFEIDEGFVNHHESNFKRISAAENNLGADENEHPYTFESVGEERKSLQIELFSELVQGNDTTEVEEHIKELDDKIEDALGRTGVKFRDRYFPHPEDDRSLKYPKLSEYVEGAEIPVVFNPDLPLDLAWEKDEVIYPEKMADIEIGPGVLEVFSDAKVLFKNPKTTELQRFYEKSFFKHGALDLKSFTTSPTEMKAQLSGFAYSEPWMITGFINEEERWMSSVEEELKEKGTDVLSDFLDTFKDSQAIFCVKTNSDEDKLIKVERKEPGKWAISLGGESADGNQFIAPRIDNDEVKH